MKIIDERTVELSKPESVANARFNDFLDRGFSVLESAARVQNEMPDLDPNLYRWFRDEPLVK